MVELAPSNDKVKRLRRLQQRRSERESAGVVVVEGRRAVGDAVAAGRVDTLFVRAGEAEPSSLTPDLRIHRLDAKTFDALASTVTPQGLLAIVRWSPSSLEQLSAGSGPVVILDGVADPGNAGTIVRVAHASGASGVVAGPGNADVTAPKVVRAAAGSLWHVPIVTSSSGAEAVASLRARSVRCVGTAARGGIPHDRYDWSTPVAVVLGSEAHGVSPAVAAQLDATVSIDMAPDADSLNVAIACAVLLFEIRRQRRNG